MLDTRAHRKWLGNERYALSVQHSERIVRRMPHRQSQRSAWDIRAVDAYAVHSARMQLQAFKRREETHFAAQLQHAAAQVLYNSAELIRADVRFRLGQYVLRRAEFHEAFQHPGAERVADTGGELSVGKRSRAALAELHVGGRVERSACPEALHRPDTAVHIRAALQHDRPVAEFAQGQRTEHSRGSEARNIDVSTKPLLSPGERQRPWLVQPDVLVLFCESAFLCGVFHRDVNRVHEADIPPCVHGGFVELRRGGLGAAQPQQGQCLCDGIVLWLVKGGLYL